MPANSPYVRFENLNELDKIPDDMYNRLDKGLIASAKQVQKNVQDSGEVPGHIKSQVQISSIEKVDRSKKQIRVYVSVSEESGTLDAAAWEWGSGIHGEKAEKYLIQPKNASALAFYWEKVGKRVVLPFVHHPGIQGIEYMKKALDKFSPQFVSTLLHGN